MNQTYQHLCAVLGDVEMQIERTQGDLDRLHERRADVLVSLRAIERVTSVEMLVKRKQADTVPIVEDASPPESKKRGR